MLAVAVIGVAVGFACERLPVTPVVQTTGAGLIGVLLGSFTAAILWLVSPPPAVQVKAVSFGLLETMIVLVATVAVAVALHFGLGASASFVRWPVLAIHRAMIVSVVGGLFGVLSFLKGGGVATPMGR